MTFNSGKLQSSQDFCPKVTSHSIYLTHMVIIKCDLNEDNHHLPLVIHVSLMRYEGYSCQCTSMKSGPLLPIKKQHIKLLSRLSW